MVTIKYNSIDPFSGISPVPLVSRQFQPIDVGERWGASTQITLNGTITGILCGNSFDDLIAKQGELLQNFNKDFQSFEIYEDAELIYYLPQAIIRSVNFGQSKYYGILPYTITLQGYPSGYFSGQWGVLEPTHSLNYEEQPDGRINITHTISARGFNTSSTISNALDNAKNFVQSLTGYSAQVVPQFINLCSGISPCVRNISENINRLNGTYSITENYIADPRDSGDGLVRYATSYDSGVAEGISRVTINGSIEAGCQALGMVGLRNKYSTLNLYDIAIGVYTGIVQLNDLNPSYISSGIQEDPRAGKLTFNVAFDNDTKPDINFDYRTNVNYDYITEIATVNFEGTVRGRGDAKTRWERVSGYYMTGINAYLYANNAYSNFGYAYPLNPVFVNSGVTFNKFVGEINITVDYNNKVIPPSGLDKFEYDLSFQPAIRKYTSKPLISGANPTGYAVFNLGYANRAACSIRGVAQVSRETNFSDGIATVKKEINYLSSQYAVGTRKVLDNYTFTTGNINAGRVFNFSAAWSYESPELII